MNVELDKLLCLLDSKITVYRIKQLKDNKISLTELANDKTYMQIVQIQLTIQDMWTKNNNE